MDDAEPLEFYSDTWRTARKQHRCDECHEHIEAGEKYLHISGKEEGRWFTFKMCRVCDVISRDYCAPLGQLRQWVMGYLGIDYVTGEEGEAWLLDE